MTRRLAPLLLAALLPACSLLVDTGALDPLDTPGGYAQAFGDQVVKYAVLCEPYSEAGAKAIVRYWFMVPLRATARAAAEGRRGYDRASAERCLAALAANSCNGDLPPACETANLFPPAVPEGGACKDDGECLAPADSCFFGAAPACPGTCRAPGALGSPCYGPDPLPGCGAGLYCKDHTISTAGSCVPLLGSGAVCMGGIPCASAYYCNTSGVCADRGAPGAACTASYQCQADTYCDGVVCRAYLPLGATCSSSGNACGAGSFCDPATSRCTAIPTTPSATGESCASPRYCDAARDYCNASAICRPFLAAGEGCSSDGQCGPRSFCSAGGICAPYGDLGAPCTTGAGGCKMGLYCAAAAGAPSGSPGRCTAALLGSPCGGLTPGESADCMEGQCGGAGSGVGTCVPYVGAGGDCTALGCDFTAYLDCVAGTCTPATSCHP